MIRADISFREIWGNVPSKKGIMKALQVQCGASDDRLLVDITQGERAGSDRYEGPRVIWRSGSNVWVLF